jgi:hypothetical protein
MSKPPSSTKRRKVEPSRVHVEELVLAVALVEPVVHVDHTPIAQPLHQRLRHLGDDAVLAADAEGRRPGSPGELADLIRVDTEICMMGDARADRVDHTAPWPQL